MIIGLMIVAMGTSAPEAAVSITSSLAGQNEMCVANVVGSNFFNILIVLGVSAFLAKLPVEKNTIKKDMPFLLLISFLLLVFCLDLNVIRIEGFLFLLLFIYFLYTTVMSDNKSNTESVDEAATSSDVDISKEVPMIKTILLSLIGVVGIVLGGDIVVDSASNIATTFGMSANLVGLTIVAVGTSLPEFITSVITVKKGETEIAIGNVIGSNIFNILFVLGLSVVISPIDISIFSFIDIVFMLITTLILFYFIKKSNSLCKKQGILFIIIYIAYMTYTIIR